MSEARMAGRCAECETGPVGGFCCKVREQPVAVVSAMPNSERVPVPPLGWLRCTQCGGRFETLHRLHAHAAEHELLGFLTEMADVNGPDSLTRLLVMKQALTRYLTGEPLNQDELRGWLK